MSRDLKAFPTGKEYYFHAEIIECAINGFWLKHVPCRPCPYPIEDKNLAIAMNNVSENKYWAISVCGKYSFISNKNTGFRLVCCQLNDSKTIDERINEKFANDYVEDQTPVVYNASTRTLI